ncbi:hypothetical protein BKA91DRAFT_139528 [Yarrowia lipolytica]|nr:hypothetical protein BKA91DRAFT_139528 [Yarrowia lipolytica]KAE8171586.1 hypothetical protein BKA90DRAFT_138790 [Yarrowia lipolytica]RMJ00947.1 hypothetical protein BD777DRAFT_121572 [Yarrowia lipolytica]
MVSLVWTAVLVSIWDASTARVVLGTSTNGIVESYCWVRCATFVEHNREMISLVLEHLGLVSDDSRVHACAMGR